MKNNVLFITSDQQHWFTLGLQNPEISTPHLDRLAKSGTLFTRAYTVNPTCTPTRASFITGTYPSQHGAYSLGTKLMEDVPVVGDVFSQAGYKTALVGKAHFQPLESTEEYPSLESYPILHDLEFWKNFDQKFYGFDHVELARNHTDEAHVGQHYALWLEEKASGNWRQYFREPAGSKSKSWGRWDIPEELHYDTWIAERTNSLLDQYKENQSSFFLWASFFDPHPEYLVPEPWASMYDPDKITVPSISEGEHKKNPIHFQLAQTENPDFSAWQEPDGNGMHGFASHLHTHEEMAKKIAIYYGMVSMMDHYIGKILNHLDQLGLTESTTVIFTTDHGHFYGHHGLNQKGPFHYEDMVRVPLIVSKPGTVPENSVSDNLQSLVDIAPSMLGACDIDIPRWMTGRNMYSEWCGKSDNHREHVLVEHHHQPTTIHLRTYIDKRYKLTVYYSRSYGELFDLQEDPGEVNNLWDEPKAESLKAELMHKLVSAMMGCDPMLMPRIAGA